MESRMSCKSGARADISTDIEALNENDMELDSMLFIFNLKK